MKLDHHDIKHMLDHEVTHALLINDPVLADCWMHTPEQDCWHSGNFDRVYNTVSSLVEDRLGVTYRVQQGWGVVIEKTP